MSLKDRDPSAATNHHRKVEIFSPSVLDLSLNVLEGRRSIGSNKSSSQSRNNFSLGYLSVHQIPLKDEHLSLATDHHLNG